MAIVGWEFLNQGVITMAGFNLINPIATVMVVLSAIALTRNSKYAVIASFPISLSLAALRLNPGYLVIMATAFGFLSMTTSLTMMGNVIYGAASTIGSSWRARRDEVSSYELNRERGVAEESRKYTLNRERGMAEESRKYKKEQRRKKESTIRDVHTLGAVMPTLSTQAAREGFFKSFPQESRIAYMTDPKELVALEELFRKKKKNTKRITQ